MFADRPRPGSATAAQRRAGQTPDSLFCQPAGGLGKRGFEPPTRTGTRLPSRYLDSAALRCPAGARSVGSFFPRCSFPRPALRAGSDAAPGRAGARPVQGSSQAAPVASRPAVMAHDVKILLGAGSAEPICGVGPQGGGPIAFSCGRNTRGEAEGAPGSLIGLQPFWSLCFNSSEHGGCGGMAG